MDLKQALSGLAQSPEADAGKPKKKVVNLPKKSSKPDKAKAAVAKEKY